MAAVKLVFLFLFLMILSDPSAAQMKVGSFGIYAEGMLRTDSAEGKVSEGFGGGLHLEVRLPIKLTGIGSVGMLHFNEKKRAPLSTIPQLNVFIIRTGLKYRLSFFYLKMEAGSAIPFKNDEYAIILSPGLGLKFSAIDIQGKYEVWLNQETQSFYGVKLGIHF